MSRAHFLCLFQGHDEYIVFHPSCADVARFASHLPVHAVGRIRIARGYAYAVENAPNLWDYLRREGHTMCRECSKASCDSEGRTVDGIPFEGKNAPVSKCAQVDWDDAWVQSTGMSRYETVPEWERLFEGFVAGFRARQQQARVNPPAGPLEIADHERVLGLVPPYDRAAIERAFKKAALKAHPDLGGTHEAMKLVNAAREALLVAA